MARRPNRSHELDEDPSEADVERFGGVTQMCPECRTELYDDAEICWKCGHALSRRPAGPPKWFIITAAALVLSIVIAYVAFAF